MLQNLSMIPPRRVSMNLKLSTLVSAVALMMVCSVQIALIKACRLWKMVIPSIPPCSIPFHGKPSDAKKRKMVT